MNEKCEIYYFGGIMRFETAVLDNKLATCLGRYWIPNQD